MKLGIVCGLASERAALGDYPAPVFVAGANAERAYLGAKQLIDDGADMLVSFGVSGALSPDLSPGDIILPYKVFSPTGKAYDAKPFSSSETLSLPIIGSDILVPTIAAKSALFKQYGAAAVDMESHSVVRAAQERGKKFAAIRAIADTADQSVPKSAHQAVAADGTIKTVRTLAALALRPWDLPSLMRLGRQSEVAHDALAQVAPRLLRKLE
ncbi:MAG: hypothetical protein AAGG79_02195, partial [Pseudomonadota bacterium]